MTGYKIRYFALVWIVHQNTTSALGEVNLPVYYLNRASWFGSLKCCQCKKSEAPFWAPTKTSDCNDVAHNVFKNHFTSMIL